MHTHAYPFGFVASLSVAQPVSSSTSPTPPPRTLCVQRASALMYNVLRKALQAQTGKTLGVAIIAAEGDAVFDGDGGQMRIGGEVATAVGTEVRERG